MPFVSFFVMRYFDQSHGCYHRFADAGWLLVKILFCCAVTVLLPPLCSIGRCCCSCCRSLVVVAVVVVVMVSVIVAVMIVVGVALLLSGLWLSQLLSWLWLLSRLRLLWQLRLLSQLWVLLCSSRSCGCRCGHHCCWFVVVVVVVLVVIVMHGMWSFSFHELYWFCLQYASRRTLMHHSFTRQPQHSGLENHSWRHHLTSRRNDFAGIAIAIQVTLITRNHNSNSNPSKLVVLSCYSHVLYLGILFSKCKIYYRNTNF